MRQSHNCVLEKKRKNNQCKFSAAKKNKSIAYQRQLAGSIAAIILLQSLVFDCETHTHTYDAHIPETRTNANSGSRSRILDILLNHNDEKKMSDREIREKREDFSRFREETSFGCDDFVWDCPKRFASSLVDPKYGIYIYQISIK